MNIVHLTTLYPGYIADFERRHPEVTALSFADHRAALYRDACGWSDYFVRHFKACGHEGLHLIANYAALQRKWAQENDFAPANGDQAFAILRAQIRQAKPDFLFVDDCYAVPEPKIRAIRDHIPSIRAVACYHGVESAIGFIPRDALVVTCVHHLAARWQEDGLRTAVVGHAFEPGILPRLRLPAAPDRLTFVGSCSPLHHSERHEWLVALKRAVPSLEVWTDSFNLSPTALLRLSVSYLARGRAGQLVQHFTSPLARQAHGAVYGLPMFEQLGSSLVTLNRHINFSLPTAANMRLFEATGAGACLVTDASDQLSRIFLPDREVVTYASTAECVEKVRWLLAHPVEAREIAARGQQRTLRDHTFAQRASQLESLFVEQLRRPGPAAI